jgi:hypothetical protein
MPSSPNYVRNYPQEYANEDTKRRRQRAMRNQARRYEIKKKGKKAVMGKDVGHKLALSRGGTNAASNFLLQKPLNNRSFSRNKDGSMKSERSRHGT